MDRLTTLANAGNGRPVETMTELGTGIWFDAQMYVGHLQSANAFSVLIHPSSPWTSDWTCIWSCRSPKQSSTPGSEYGYFRSESPDHHHSAADIVPDAWRLTGARRKTWPGRSNRQALRDSRSTRLTMIQFRGALSEVNQRAASRESTISS